MSSLQPVNISDILEEIRDDITPLLAENGQSYDRLLSTFKIAVQQEPKILLCTPESIRREISKCAADGLVPDAKEAVILHYYDNKEKVFIANYQPMVQGIIKRVKELGGVFSIVCKLVHENDEFTLNEADPDSLVHNSNPFAPAEKRGAVVGGYVVFRDEHKRLMHLETMSLEDFQRVQEASKAPESPAWKKWKSEMYRKAVIRRGSKYVPINNMKIRAMIERVDDMFDFKQTSIATAERINPFGGAPLVDARPNQAPAIENKQTPVFEMPISQDEKEPVPAKAEVGTQPAAQSQAPQQTRESIKKPKALEDAPAVPDIMTSDPDETAAVAVSFGKVLAIANAPDCSVEDRRGILKMIVEEKKKALPEHLHEALRVVISMVDWCLQREAREMPWASDHMMFTQKLAAKLDVERIDVGTYR